MRGEPEKVRDRFFLGLQPVLELWHARDAVDVPRDREPHLFQLRDAARGYVVRPLRPSCVVHFGHPTPGAAEAVDLEPLVVQLVLFEPLLVIEQLLVVFELLVPQLGLRRRPFVRRRCERQVVRSDDFRLGDSGVEGAQADLCEHRNHVVGRDETS